LILRDYQNDAVKSIYDYYADGNTGNPIVAMPTGTGKSLVIGDFVKGACTAFYDQRIMMLTHVKELIEQNFEKLVTLWPTAPAGIFSAGLKRRETHCRITFGGIGSVSGNAHLFGKVDLILIDECHLVSPKASTMYRKFIKELKEINPNLKVIGFTATPYRLGLGHLTDGDLFDDVCYDITGIDAFNKLVAEAYLAPLTAKRTDMEFDMSDVKIQGGEYVTSQMQAAVDKEQLTYQAVQEIIQYGSKRKHWLIFAAGIDHANNICEMLDTFNISCVSIHSKMSAQERDQALIDYKAGKYQAAVNNNVLTTGFDFPGIDLIAALRPTSSPGLWVQMLGRGTRPVFEDGFDLSTINGRHEAMAASHKQNCLVLDFAGNTRRLGPINDPVLPKRKGAKGGGVAPVRICEACNTYNHASARVCIECGAEFPRELKIHGTAYTDEVMKSSMPVIETFPVTKVIYTEHRKQNRPPAIQVTYYCGLRIFKEWVCLEHENFAGKKAREWWRERSAEEPPSTTADALKGMDRVAVPTHIRVWLKKPYPEVKAYDFTGSSFGAVGAAQALN
jgi:DNA repair protein RadD